MQEGKEGCAFRTLADVNGGAVETWDVDRDIHKFRIIVSLLSFLYNGPAFLTRY